MNNPFCFSFFLKKKFFPKETVKSAAVNMTFVFTFEELKRDQKVW